MPGLYFSTLEGSIHIPSAGQGSRSPGKTILSFDREVGGTSFAFRVGVIGTEGKRFLHRWIIHVHVVIVVVRHFGIQSLHGQKYYHGVFYFAGVVSLDVGDAWAPEIDATRRPKMAQP